MSIISNVKHWCDKMKLKYFTSELKIYYDILTQNKHQINLIKFLSVKDYSGKRSDVDTILTDTLEFIKVLRTGLHYLSHENGNLDINYILSLNKKYYGLNYTDEPVTQGLDDTVVSDDINRLIHLNNYMVDRQYRYMLSCQYDAFVTEHMFSGYLGITGKDNLSYKDIYHVLDNYLSSLHAAINRLIEEANSYYLVLPRHQYWIIVSGNIIDIVYLILEHHIGNILNIKE